MKKGIVLLLVMSLSVGLFACGEQPQNHEQPTQGSNITEPAALPTEPPVIATTAAPTQASNVTSTVADPTEVPPAATPTEAPAEEPHSDLYIPGISPDQIVAYFNEVVLNMEYTTGDGDASLVQKWDRPIYYRIDGAPTRQDALIINRIAGQLNDVEGFPGIYAATGLEQNVTISFLWDAEFDERFSRVIDGEDADGAVQFWYYNDINVIYSARIGYRKSVDQKIRDSVIQEEILNMLGISDTTQRKDSITYQYGNENVALSEVDLVIIKLLYNPAIKCGMNAAQCEVIIRELYY